MKSSRSLVRTACSLFFYVIQLSSQVLAGTQFASHVSVNTPARSFSHGVGDPVSSLTRRSYNSQSLRPSPRSFRAPVQNDGYPRERPAIPFFREEARRDSSLGFHPWQQNNYMDVALPLLPPSPYKVDSPDPESLWPEGLFLPPISPPRFLTHVGRTDKSLIHPGPASMDPYLLEGSDALAAVAKAKRHGLLYFHDIPHIKSLLMNQELRIQNRLEPHRLGSIRHTWPYNRP